MPKTKHARRKRPRAQRSAKNRLRKLLDRAFDMEVPLTEAMEFVQALQMIGDGMVAGHDDEGRPIAAVARAAAERLDALKDAWRAMIRVASRRNLAR